jgi:hypothetical protein
MAHIGEHTELTITMVAKGTNLHREREYQLVLESRVNGNVYTYYSHENVSFGQALEVITAAHYSKSNNLIMIPYIEQHFNPAD